ncbi:MAG: hypothetical protein NTZ09_07790, partial [Candidatus Hydrogenedentes bacterium]|nr:hypothetical protein [Candidatus Hydrogenedentota bacterium]
GGKCTNSSVRIGIRTYSDALPDSAAGSLWRRSPAKGSRAVEAAMVLEPRSSRSSTPPRCL